MRPSKVSRRRFVTTLGVGGAALIGVGVSAARGKPRNFRTHLSGDEVVPPVDTNAQGQAKFQLNKAGNELSFKLNVANIEDVIGAHIHNAPAGQPGGIVVFLYGDPFAPAVTVNGTLVEGTISSSDVIGLTLNELITEMEAGNTYVQVHTRENRGGEIRGQIH